MSRSIYQFQDLPQEERAAAPIARAPVQPVKADRLVGILRNPRSYRNKARDAQIADRSNVVLAEPANRDAIPEVLADFARRGVHYLVIDGGDGTIRDVLTAGAPIFGASWPRLLVLPSGKTNALTVDLGMPRNWSLGDALDAIETGGRIERNPLAIRPADGRSGLVQGFIMGAGAFAKATEAGQTAHRWGAFNSVVVAVSAIWIALRTFFGTRASPYRRGSRMDVVLEPDGERLPHAGRGDRSRRYFLLASTLERFPINLKPFANLREGLRIAVMDEPRRRLLLSLPLLAFGWHGNWVRRHGVHRKWAEEFTIATETPFIIDGEAFPPGKYVVAQGPRLRFVTP